MLEQLIHYLIVVLISSTRFTYGPLYGLGVGLSFTESFICSLIGGLSGTLFYYFIASKLFKYYAKKRRESLKKKPIFTKTNRKIIRIKQRFGIIGIGFLTVPVFSIMIGSMIAWKFFHHKKTTLPILFGFVLFYNILYCVLYYFIKDTVS